MATKRFKPNAKPSGVLGSSKTAGRCKRAQGTSTAHTPVDQPHPSIPGITRSVCSGCGKVLSWKAGAH